MAVYWIDPTRDPRWPELVERDPHGSIFHTQGWIEALCRTYRYRPMAATTCPPHLPLSNGIPFCLVDSWLTGRRLVSMPFSDHCQPLAESREECEELLRGLRRHLIETDLKFFELRPLDAAGFPSSGAAGLQPAESYVHHRLDLRPPIDDIASRFHRDCIRRKIRRAEKERLEIRSGRSGAILDDFYRLQVATRRRQGVPSQPMAWFRNLSECLGESLLVQVASKDSTPVAALLTLRHKATCTFKYGCSDAERNALGGTQLLLWMTIQNGRAAGAESLDMGRSDLTHEGLIEFKDRWGAVRSELTYWRYARAQRGQAAIWRGKLMGSKALSLPFRLFPQIGRVLYRHFA